MKKFILLAGLLVTSLSYATENYSLKNHEVNNRWVDQCDLEVSQSYNDPVLVSFSRKNFKIQVLEKHDSPQELIKFNVNNGDIRMSILRVRIYIYKSNFLLKN
jgi:hypothetical protein